MTGTKEEQLQRGKELVQEFCEANGLETPKTFIKPKDQWSFPKTCAFYRADRIFICPELCSNIGTAGRAWSYPGYAIDRTPYGVMAHECGHHVDLHMLSIEGSAGPYWSDYSMKMRAATKEKPISGYCPNDAEWFAEIFRLFMTNSDLLQRIRPKTYALITERFKPIIDLHWKTVLKDAPDRTIEMAQRKIDNA